MNKDGFENADQSGQSGTRQGADQPAARLTKMKRVGADVGHIGEEVAAYVKKQPLAAVGIALGAGFVLGSILGSRLGRIALIAAVGYAAQDLVEAALGEGGVRKLFVDEVSKLVKNDNKTNS